VKCFVMKKASILAFFVITSFILLPINSTYSQPMWHSNTATIETSEMVIRFFNKQPHYMFWIPGENNTAVYIVKFLEIIEFLDKNADGVYSSGDTILARAQLLEASVNWNITAETLSGPQDSVEVRITMQAQVPVLGMMPSGSIGHVNVIFVNHIYDKDVDVNGYVVEGNKELKIDVIIENWPWVNENSLLALGIIFAGHFRGEHGVPHMEHHRVRENVREVRMRCEEGAFEGAFRYREEVQIREESGNRTEKVKASEDFSAHSAIMYLVYPHFEGVLTHDPSILVIKPTGDVLSLIQSYLVYIVIATVVIIGAVILIKRK